MTSFRTLLPQSSFRSILLLSLLVVIISRSIIISRPLPYLDSLIIPDDAYISLHIAKNIADGKGPLYGTDHTNGFQPLYVFLAVPIFWVFDNPDYAVKAALVLLMLFDAATLALLLGLIFAVTKDLRSVTLGALFWIINDYVIQTSLNGLETIIASFFIMLATYQFYQLYQSESSRRLQSYLFLGLTLGFAFISRVDSGIFAAILGITLLVKEVKIKDRLILKAALIGLGALIIFSGWVAYSWYYTEMWYPISGKAVRFLSLTTVQHQPTFENWYGPLMSKGLSVMTKQNIILIGFAALAVSLLVIKRKRLPPHFATLIPLGIFALSLYFAYTLYIFAPWYFYRYFFPITLFLILLLVFLCHTVMETLDQKRASYFYVVILCGWITAQLAKGELLSYYFSTRSDYGYMNLGMYIKNRLPQGAIIGGSQTGALSYFADNAVTVNLDGVVNKACFIALQERKLMDYIKEQNIEYIVGWKSNITIIEDHSENFDTKDLELVEKIDIKTWDRDWYIYKVNLGTGK